MDDLESDLFGSFGGKKSNQKSKGLVFGALPSVHFSVDKCSSCLLVIALI